MYRYLGHEAKVMNAQLVDNIAVKH